MVLSAGRVVEQGTHRELLALKSLYYKLTQQQYCLANDKDKGIGTHEEDSPVHDELPPAEKQLSSNPLLSGGKEVAEDEKHSNSNETVSSSKKSASILDLVKFCYRLNQRMLLPICGGLLFSVIAGGSHPAYVAIPKKYTFPVESSPISSVADVLAESISSLSLMRSIADNQYSLPKSWGPSPHNLPSLVTSAARWTFGVPCIF